MKNEVRRVFQNDAWRKAPSEDRSILFELFHRGRLALFSENADVSMRVFQIGCDIDLIHRHEHTLESNFACDNRAQLAFQ